MAEFYAKEVIEPGDALIRSILQRGMDRGEFRTIDLKYGVFTILAPLLFLALWKHSFGAQTSQVMSLVPEKYLATQLETILYGLTAPGDKA